MLFAYVKVDPVQPALERGEVALGRVGVDVSAHVLSHVVDSLVASELLVEARVEAEGVSHDSRATVNVPADHVLDHGATHVRNVLRLRSAAKLDENHQGCFVAEGVRSAGPNSRSNGASRSNNPTLSQSRPRLRPILTSRRTPALTRRMIAARAVSWLRTPSTSCTVRTSTTGCAGSASISFLAPAPRRGLPACSSQRV